MLADEKIERSLNFLPAQLLQLENIPGAAPDLQKNRFYTLDPNTPASLHMVLGPLFLFEAVFVENRRVMELSGASF